MDDATQQALLYIITIQRLLWISMHRDFEAKCARLGQAIKQETDQVTGKRDLARLSHWFEAFGQHTGQQHHVSTPPPRPLPQHSLSLHIHIHQIHTQTSSVHVQCNTCAS